MTQYTPHTTKISTSSNMTIKSPLLQVRGLPQLVLIHKAYYSVKILLSRPIPNEKMALLGHRPLHVQTMHRSSKMLTILRQRGSINSGIRTVASKSQSVPHSTRTIYSSNLRLTQQNAIERKISLNKVIGIRSTHKLQSTQSLKKIKFKPATASRKA